MSESESEMWHTRLGHMNMKAIREMVAKGIISGVKLTDEENFVCEGCFYRKQHNNKEKQLQVS